jgi:hypothetical protein
MFARSEPLPVPGVAQHHAGCLTGQPPGRFRGNVDAVLERGLTGLLGSASTGASTQAGNAARGGTGEPHGYA